MELEEFKNIWQTSQQRESYQQNIDNESVMLMTKQKSKAISDKLRRNLDIDMIVSSLFIPPLLYVMLWSDFKIYHKFVAGFFLIYTVISLFYYRKIISLYKKVNLQNDLLTTLKFTIDQFSKQVKTLTLYNQITIIPVMFYGTMVGKELISWRNNGTSFTLTEMLISTFIITPIGYFYMKYIIKVFYGNHLEKLKQHLAELENET